MWIIIFSVGEFKSKSCTWCPRSSTRLPSTGPSWQYLHYEWTQADKYQVGCQLSFSSECNENSTAVVHCYSRHAGEDW